MKITGVQGKPIKCSCCGGDDFFIRRDGFNCYLLKCLKCGSIQLLQFGGGGGGGGKVERNDRAYQ